MTIDIMKTNLYIAEGDTLGTILMPKTNLYVAESDLSGIKFYKGNGYVVEGNKRRRSTFVP